MNWYVSAVVVSLNVEVLIRCPERGSQRVKELGGRSRKRGKWAHARSERERESDIVCASFRKSRGASGTKRGRQQSGEVEICLFSVSLDWNTLAAARDACQQRMQLMLHGSSLNTVRVCVCVVRIRRRACVWNLCFTSIDLTQICSYPSLTLFLVSDTVIIASMTKTSNALWEM